MGARRRGQPRSICSSASDYAPAENGAALRPDFARICTHPRRGVRPSRQGPATKQRERPGAVRVKALRRQRQGAVGAGGLPTPCPRAGRRAVGTTRAPNQASGTCPRGARRGWPGGRLSAQRTTARGANAVQGCQMQPSGGPPPAHPGRRSIAKARYSLCAALHGRPEPPCAAVARLRYILPFGPNYRAERCRVPERVWFWLNPAARAARIDHARKHTHAHTHIQSALVSLTTPPHTWRRARNVSAALRTRERAAVVSASDALSVRRAEARASVAATAACACSTAASAGAE